jgi:hypothetical protein
MNKLRPFYLPTLLMLIACVGLFVVFNLFKPGPVHDEQYHKKTSDYFAAMIVGSEPFTLDYANSLGPLFYLIQGFLSAVSHQSLIVARLLSFIVSVGTIYLIFHSSKIRDDDSKWMPLVLYFSGSWALLGSMSLHSEAFAGFCLTIVCISFANAINSQNNKCLTENWALVSLGITSAVLIRVYMVFLIPTVFICAVILLGFKNWRPYFWTLMGVILPILLWIHWGGLVPPQFAHGNELSTPLQYRTGFGGSGQNLSWSMERLLRIPSMAAHLGIYALPWLWTLRSRFIKNSTSILIFSFVAMVSGLLLSLGMAGPVDSLLRKILNIAKVVPFTPVSDEIFLVRVIYTVGMFSFLTFLWCGRKHILQRDPLTCICLLCLLFYALSLPFSGVLFVERYLHPMCLVVTLFGLSITNDLKRDLWPWFPFLLMSVLHAFSKGLS